MGLNKGKRFYTLTSLLALLVLVVTATLLLRGQYASNLLKMAVLSRLQDATGQQVTAQKMYLNLLPPFIEARDVKAFDAEGNRFFGTKRVKVYLDLWGLLKRRIVLRRVVVVEPELKVYSALVESVRENLGGNGGGGKGVSLETVMVIDGAVTVEDLWVKAKVSASGIDAEASFDDRPVVRFSASEINAEADGWPEMSLTASGKALFGKEGVDLHDMEISSLGSRIRAGGVYRGGKTGEFHVDADFLVDSMKRLLDLGGPGEGTINAEGNVRFEEDIKKTNIDLKLGGDIYLETLMELVRASEKADLRGRADFKGTLKGEVTDLKGSGRASLGSGGFFGIDVGKTVCDVEYSGGVLVFRKGTAELYGGSADVEVSIALPHVDRYSVDVSFEGVDMKPALGLISLEKLPLPPGRVRGELHASGSEFNPEGWLVFGYEKTSEGPVGRIRQISGSYKMEGQKVTLSVFEANTEVSRMVFGGSVDISTRAIDVKGRVDTRDIYDLTEPYLGLLHGGGRLEASVLGTFEEPVVSVGASLSDVFLGGYLLGDASGEMTYGVGSLKVKYATAGSKDKKIDAHGEILFPKAGGLFDFDEPQFALSASAVGLDVKAAFGLFGIDLPLSAVADTAFEVSGGPAPVLSGVATVKDIVFMDRPVSGGDFDFAYADGIFSIDRGNFVHGESALRLDASFSGSDFNVKAESGSLALVDVLGRTTPVNMKMTLRVEGGGPYEDPVISASIGILSAEFIDASLGAGMAEVSVEDKRLKVNARLFDGKASVAGSAELKGDFPWKAWLVVERGDYGSLVSPFLKTKPEDFMLNMSGAAEFSGDRRGFEASASLDSLNLNMYGQGFSNDSDVVVGYKGGKLSISRFAMRSGNAAFSIGGSVSLRSSYDIIIEGNSSLAPLSALSDKIEAIRGDTSFVFAIRGPWDDPSISGGISVSGGSLALKGIPQRVSSINGYVYVDEDRAVVDGISAKFGGGDVRLTGIVELAGFNPDKAYIDAAVSDVTLIVSKGFSVNLGGDLLLRLDEGARLVTGELRVNRAVYKERLEWKSWLLEARRRKAPRAEAAGWGEKVMLNVKVHGMDDIIVDNNIASAKLVIDLVVRGTLGSPLLFGRVESREGKVFFRNSEFRIVNATADYSDAVYTNPFIGIRAETNIQGYNILLNLEGRLDLLDLTLTSNPPLDDVQILGLLTLGEFGENLSGLEGGIGAAEATSFLTGKFQDVFEERFTDITGLDRFQIDPYVSSTGSVTPRVTVGKKLMTDRLFVTYATTGEEQELNLEYVLYENVSLLGGQDEKGSIGGDIKFRFHFK